MGLNFKKVERWTKLFRDLLLIFGIPAIAAVAVKLHEEQAAAFKLQNEVLQTQNSLLKETSYDKALSLIESQKKLFENERADYQVQITSLSQATESNRVQLDYLQSKFARINKRIQNFYGDKAEVMGYVNGPNGLILTNYTVPQTLDIEDIFSSNSMRLPIQPKMNIKVVPN
jgi:uncharacterized protein HemX